MSTNPIARGVLQAIIALLLIWVWPFIAAILLLLQPIKLTIQYLARKNRPDLREFVSGTSAVLTNYPSLNIVYFFYVEGEVSVARARFLIQNNVLTLENARGQRIYEKLGQGWTNYYGYPFWREDANFKLENHIREYDYQGDLSLKKYCSEEEAQKVFGGLLTAPWKEGRSPWEGLLIPVASKNENDRTLLILRHHHLLMDGYSVVPFLKAFAKTEFDLAKAKASFSKQFGIWDFVKVPYDFAGVLLDSWDFQMEWHFPEEKTSPRNYQVAFAKPFSTSLIRKAKDKHRISYAAVLFSVVGGGIQRMFREAQLPVPEYLSTNFPVPRPRHPGGLVNHVSICAFKWPIKSDSALKRANIIHHKFNDLTQSLATGLLFFVGEIIGVLPSSAQHFMSNALVAGSSILATSFPVPDQQAYFDGIEVSRMSAAMGTPGNSIGTTIVMGGMNGLQGAVVTLDKRIFPNEEILNRFSEFVELELQSLLE